MVKKYTPLVKYIASRVIIGKNKYVDYEDLVSCGMIGLMDAFNKFDESKGMKFSTYASIRIKGSMIDEIRRNAPISKTAMDKLNRYNEAVENLQHKLMREPNIEEISSALGISVNNIIEIENNINYISMVSLENLVFSEEDDMPLIGAIEDKTSPNPEESLEEKEKLEYLAKALDILKEKDRLILSLYYYERLTLKEIGKILEVSESRVCQLHSRAILNLKKAMQKLKYTQME
ncbi:FliA/WhiG family RNA polymerase sigma factor [Clostridium sp. MSJ-4]|uniref:FliA/WhiG family RNA polymerase sigma factor n=1 Tax=Clostridium simiarum TaxID=2841506 RepID=A0ABS6EXV6_9CLOT|nr:FliA/WhiG family RNA polymerase sigma factor [Clostridium simiarum]MBU5591060.1 FliA/WhiG family RNA polymerase sigma factor [Clostridium simiarum]